ncbi:hypothetical protein [Chamaesiphon sp.]|uniref:hypothetical protein n=1 Tax=Chamaesiphon sp. TaxID=2814140 RepID=UPI00359367FA
MSKLTSLAIGLLTAVAIFPTTSAMAATSKAATIAKPAGDLHAQVIFKIGPRYRDRGYYSDWERERFRRRLEWHREREARWRSRFYYPRDRYYGYGHRNYHRDYRYYR